MAKQSSDLIFGTGIVNLFSRTPAILAQTAASIYELSEGRFILGLGLSGPIVVKNWHGLSYYHPSPLQRSREYLEILRMMFSGEQVNYSGEIFQLRNFRLKYFKTPLDIPIFLAALGPRNIELTGELADGWFPIWVPISKISTLLSILAQGKKKRNSNMPQNLVISPFVITCASQSEKAKNLVKKHIAYYVGGMGTFYNNFMKRLGFSKEADKIMIAWKQGNRELAAQQVSESMLKQIAITGNPEEVRARYLELYQKNISLPVVMLPYNCPPDFAIDTIGALAYLF
jgi:alkanesulfonate monooxygenase SsuD/methylene tetrahydromethanopterin reductase-like flavin-dependent oxidoreductase (luciferase family)